MPPSPFVFPIGDLLRSDAMPRRVSVEVPVDWGVELSRTAPSVPLTANLTLEHVSGGILARGTVDVVIHSTCHRCLAESDDVLELDVAQMFVPHTAFDDESDDADNDEYELTGDHIDLETMVRDEVILAMPMLPTCGDDCAGITIEHLVSDRETGLNTDAPGDEGAKSSPFSVLQELFDEGE